MTPTPLPIIGFNRRELLQVGYSALLGVSAASAVAGRVAGAAPAKKPKSVILVFLTGGASQLELFDPKPDAPAEIRGAYAAVKTRTPGLLACELLPKLADRSDKFAVVRTLSHDDNNHTAATHHVLTGAVQPNRRFDKPLSREDWPVYAAGLSYFRSSATGLPAGVSLPRFLKDDGAGLVWPGQHGGWLGPRHDPWQLNGDPNSPKFKTDAVRLAPGLDVTALGDRRALLAEMNRGQRLLADSAEAGKLTDQQAKAFDLLTSGAAAKAFELDREPAAVRDKYGRHLFGQSLLLARRLVQAGVPMVQASMGGVQNWDTHSDHFNQAKSRLLPPLDQAVSALLDDLHDTGLLDDTLVVMTGEFGRAPKVSKQAPTAVAGRDHWAPCFSGLFAGGGVRGGQVIGRSDASAAYPVTAPFSPDDVGATVYAALGIDPASEVRDKFDRPVTLNRGQVIRSLYTGS